MNYLCFDIENNSTKRYKRNAGNFMYDYAVAFGYKYMANSFAKSGYVFMDDVGVLPYSGWLKAITHLVGHNLKHDLLFAWHSTELQDWLQAGGQIWDTQLAEYYLTSFENKYPSLRDIAVNKYGCKERPKHIDKLLFNIPEGQRTIYKQVNDLPKELVLEDVKNDVLDTEQVFLKQFKKAEQLGIVDVIQIQMNYLLATIEMEYNGFFVDLERLNKNKKELQDKLDPIKKQFLDLVNKYIPEKEFEEHPRKGLELLLFGGVLKTICKEKALDSKGLPIIIHTGQNKGHFKLKNQVKNIKINGLGINILEHWKTKAGNISINETVLNEILCLNTKLCDTYLVCSHLLEIRSIEKQLSTYYTAIEDLIYTVDGCIHGKFNHCATDTGRLSSNEPNLQNIPRKGNSKVKEHFITRY